MNGGWVKRKMEFGVGNDNSVGKEIYYVVIIIVFWRLVRVWIGIEI